MLRVDIADAVAEVTVENPPVNALTNEMYERLGELMDELEADDAVRVVMFLSDHPTIFMAGADINAMQNYDFSPEAIEWKVRLVHGTFQKIQRLPKPTIVSLEGHALGGGCEISLCMDARFMTRGKARIGLPEARLGIIPGGGGTQRLARLVGRGHAAQMMMLGEGIDADRAAAIGLVNEACDDPGATRERAREHAARLTRMPSSSLRLIKTALNDGYDAGLAAGLEVERACAIEALLAPEAKEGIAAFVEKRPADFHGVPR